VHDLAQIGIGVGRVHQLGPSIDWPASATVRRVGWPEYASSPHDLVLDVRHAHEHAAGHLPDARLGPLPELWREAARLPAGQIWLYCCSGFRATVGLGIDRAA
jgi:hypothetical protein